MIDDLEQPRCKQCGTVLRDDPRGFECVPCGIVYLRDGGTMQRVVNAG